MTDFLQKLVAAAEAEDAFTGFTGITRRDRGQNPSGAPLQGADLKRALTLSPNAPKDTSSDIGASMSRNNSVSSLPPKALSSIEPITRSNTIAAPRYSPPAKPAQGVARGPSFRLQPSTPIKSPHSAAPSTMARRPSLTITQAQAGAGPRSAAPLTYDSPPSLTHDGMTDSNTSSPANGPTRYVSPRTMQPKNDAPGPRGKSMRATELYDDYYNNPGKYDQDIPELPVIIERYAQPESPPGRHAISSWNNKVDRSPGRKMSLSRRLSASALGSYDADRQDAMGRRPSYSASQRSRGSRRSGYPDGSDSGEDFERDMEKVRVKVHYGKDVRGMAIVPNTTLDDFVHRIAQKFSKSVDDVEIKFKDEEGDFVSLKDEDDFESAVDCARAASKGRAEGKLEVWIEASGA